MICHKYTLKIVPKWTFCKWVSKFYLQIPIGYKAHEDTYNIIYDDTFSSS